MNTQAHIILNLGLLTKKGDRIRYYVLAMISGLIPDFPMLIFYIVEKTINRTPESLIWLEKYYLPAWQNFINVFNSLVLLLPLLLVAYILYKKFDSRDMLIICLGMITHIGSDFFLHFDDGHAAFFPFSNFVFSSPVSYWDPNHFGVPASILEICLVAYLSYRIYKKIISRKRRNIFFVIALLTILFSVFSTSMIFYFHSKGLDMHS